MTNEYKNSDRFIADPVNNRPANAEPLEFFTPRINKVFGEALTQYQGQKLIEKSVMAYYYL